MDGNRFYKPLALFTICNIVIGFWFYDLSDLLPLSFVKMTVEQSENWAVLDDAYDQCDDVTSFTKQKGWTVVVVSQSQRDIKGCSSPRCFQVTNTYVNTWMSHFSTVKLLSRASLLSGYLLALQNGAKIILDADCDSPVEEINQSFRLDQFHQSGLSYSDTPFFNPFHHFGVMEAFPKEVLLVKRSGRITENMNSDKYTITENMNSDKYTITDWSSIPIRQGVKVSKKTCFKTPDSVINTKNIIQSAPVSVRYPSIAPYNTGPTLFFKDVFMLMFVPPNIDVDKQQLFRTLLFNVLNKLSLINFAFYYIPNKEDINSDCIQSDDISNYTGTLRNILECVSPCKELESKAECFANIYGQLWTCFVREFPHLEKSFNITSLVNSWYKDLLSLGYTVNNNFSFQSKNMFKMMYRIPKQIAQFKIIKSEVKEAIYKAVIAICGQAETKAWHAVQRMSNPKIDDIVLIVVINYEKLFASVSYNEYVHRQYFKYIVYCVPSLTSFDNYTANIGLSYVTFIEGNAIGWRFFYQCTSAAMKLSLPVKGYLQVGDDVLLNTWNVVEMPRHEMMMFPNEKYVDLYKKDPNYYWPHWNSKFGQTAVQKALFELKNASELNSYEQRLKYPRVDFPHFANNFMENLKAQAGSDLVPYGGTDIFYIPERFRNEYITATEIFCRNECMVELALRIIHLGLKPPGEKKYLIDGTELWGSDRNKIWLKFNASHQMFLHPFKWLRDTRKEEGKQFACQKYLPLLN